MEVKGHTLILKADLTKRYGRSTSGKHTVVATSSGAISIPGHPELKLALNIYTK